MRRRACVAILAVLIIGGFGIVGLARAGFYDGNKLMVDYKEFEKAESPTGYKDKSISWMQDGIFIGYVLGVFDSNDSKICTPDGNISIKAVCTIAGNYLKVHPESWGQPANKIVLRSLKEAYPCPKK